MLSRQEIDGLVEAARSETKQWGGEEPGLLHLAEVVRRRWRAEFAEVFGDDGAGEVRPALEAGQKAGDESTIREMLGAGGSRAEIVARLHARLAAENLDESPVPGWVETVEPRSDVIGREADLDELMAQLTTVTDQPVLLVGEAGAGRTAVLGALAARLAVDTPPRRLHRVPSTSFIDPDTVFGFLREAPAGDIVVIDDIDRLAYLGSADVDLKYLRVAQVGSAASPARLLLTITTEQLPRFDQLAPGFGARVTLRELEAADLAGIVAREAEPLAEAHGSTLDDALLDAALAPASPCDHRSHPGLALLRLDRALSRARIAGVQRATVDHLADGAAGSQIARETIDLETALARRIRGQDEAIAVVARRLGLTRADLDLRPERPDGVFLFVGPTGVGKTEMAREIARFEYGSADRLIRLDMSEYAHPSAITRLTGPQPGYVGSDQPGNWLTTRVAANPDCVVLLDEVEKAHPQVWNTFLQVFDAGRLTDSRGVTADFSNAVIIMTSNLGAREANREAIGFGNTGRSPDRLNEKVMSAVTDAMPPELINRLDEIAVFNVLTPEAIGQIAADAFDGVCRRLANQGWTIEADDSVVGYLADHGYDPDFGARHLQRNIERHFLAELPALAVNGQTRVRVSVDGDRLVVAAAD